MLTRGSGTATHVLAVLARAPMAGALVAGALAALALTPACASGALVKLPGGPTLSVEPLRGTAAASPLDAYFSNLDYNGGPVMPSNTNYPVYWQPPTAPAYPAEYESGIDAFFEDLAHDSGASTNVDSVAAQYNDAAGAFASYSSHFGGALVDTDAYPANGCKRAPICLTDAQLRAELTRFVEANHLPTDLEHEYFLLTPPAVEDCLNAAASECSAGSTAPSYCAYHGDVALAGGRGEIVYATDPFVTGVARCDDGNHPNGKPSDGAIEGGLSHEHDESITDPEPNSAWTDFGSGGGGEVGDKCRTFEAGSEFGTPLGTTEAGASYNQLIDGHPYWYQQEWSNQGDECMQRLSFGGLQPTAAFTWEDRTGNEVSFDAGTSLAPGRTIVRYGWQFNEGGEPRTPEETSSPTISHTFLAGGIYTVALTIFTEDGARAEAGTSAGTALLVSAGTPPAPAVTLVKPAKGAPAGGTPVVIKGSSFTAATAVSFGSLPAGAFTVVSPSEIVAVTPESSAGTVSVSVTAPGGKSASATASRFRFGPPAIASLAPSAGPAAGGTQVTITGTGFAPGAGATSFKFGSVPATGVECSSHTTCIAVSPKHAVGTVEVKALVNRLPTPKDPPADQFAYG